MKIKKIICSLGLAIMIFSAYAINYGENKTHEEAKSYWDAVYNNDVSMSTEEQIENSFMVIPLDINIQFETSEELDGIQYGYITIICHERESLNGKKYTRTSASSDKNITNGLYKKNIPMIKFKSERSDVDWFYYPSTDYSKLVFIKFSIDNYISEWLPVIGVSLSPEEELSNRRVFSSQKFKLTKKIEVSLKNPIAENFKVEGIRVVYNCDYDVIRNEQYQIYRFVNDDKQNSQTVVMAGAKYIDLKDSVMNNITYEWIDNNQQVTINSMEKINFYDEMTKEAFCKENFDKIQNIIDLRYYRTDILDKDRQYYESLKQKIQQTDFTQKQREQLENLLEVFLNKYDELLKEKIYNTNFDNLYQEIYPFTEPNYDLINNERQFYETFIKKIQETEMTDKQREILHTIIEKTLENFDEAVSRKQELIRNEQIKQEKAVKEALLFINELIESEVKFLTYFTGLEQPMLIKGNKNSKDYYLIPIIKGRDIYQDPGNYKNDINYKKYELLINTYQINIESLYKIMFYLVCNKWSRQNNLSDFYMVKDNQINSFETEVEYFIVNYDKIYYDLNSSGWHCPSNNEIEDIMKRRKNNSVKKNLDIHISEDEIKSGKFFIR